MDYKIVQITENDDGTITVVQRLYEGAVTVEPESYYDDTNTLITEDISRYRRTAFLQEIEYVLNV